MSFTTGTQYETVSAQPGAGTALLGNAGAGTATVISKTTSPMGAAKLGADFFPPSTGVGKGLHVSARGVYTTTATPQTLAALSVYANTTQGTAGTALGPLGVATVSVTSASAWWWGYEADIICTATGSSGTWLCMGQAFFATAVNTSALAPNWYSVGSTTAVTLSTESAYYLEMVATWTNANTSASSSITCNVFNVYGIN